MSFDFDEEETEVEKTFQEEVEEWTAWVPDLLSAIEAGYLDSSLKQIVKAGWTRAQELGVPAKTDTTDNTTNTKILTYHGLVVGEPGGGMFTPTRVKSTNGTLAIFGFRYSKSQMVGKVVRLKNVDRKAFYLEGALVTIESVGTRFLKGRFTVDPTPLFPESYKLKEFWGNQQRDSEWTLTVEPSYIQHAFRAETGE